MEILACVKLVFETDEKGRKHYSNLLIGKEGNQYTVWSNWSDHQQTYEKTDDLELAAGVFNLWKERAKKDGNFLEQYKDSPMEVVGYENTSHPFLTA